MGNVFTCRAWHGWVGVHGCCVMALISHASIHIRLRKASTRVIFVLIWFAWSDTLGVSASSALPT